MSIEKDDPRLTAFALGELEDAAFAAELNKDPAAMAEVDAIRAMARRVTDELSAERADGLTAAQREAITPPAQARSMTWVFPAAAAALLAGLVFALIPRKQEESDALALARKEIERLERDLGAQQNRASQALADKVDAEKQLAEISQSHKQAQATRASLAAQMKALQATNKAFKDWLERYANEANGTTRDKLHFKKKWEAEVQNRVRLEALLQKYERGPNGGVPPGMREPKDAEPPPPPPNDPGGGAPYSKADAKHAVVHKLHDIPNAKTRTPFKEAQRLLRDMDGRYSRTHGSPGSEGYARLVDNPFRLAERDPSTFSIDVDTASYANVRRFLTQGRLPPPDAVRIEELINYFSYRYAPPEKDAEHPFRAHVAIAGCPWNPKHRLARIAIKGKVIERAERPATNLVFLIDVSGSMSPANKLPLLVRGMHLLVDQLDARDRVAIVTYASSPGLRLDSTRGDDKDKIRAVLDGLASGGSTNGAGGIQLAYDIARKHFIKEGANRVILATDGDFNVGVSDTGGLTRLIEKEARSGVFLSVLGFGQGNYKDDKMEELSNRGNGNYTYVDSLAQAKRALVDQMTGTLVTIAKDVKIQVFFNPQRVAAYRLIGYANRLLKAQDFNDDTKDAGEIGAGHAVTALYEIVPVGVASPVPTIDENPFIGKPAKGVDSDALFQLRLRYKPPAEDKSRLIEATFRDAGGGFDQADADFRWAAAIAAFGMQLRGSRYRGQIAWPGIREIAASATDDFKDRREALGLLDIAMRKAGVKPPVPAVKTPGTRARVRTVKGNVVTIDAPGARVGDTFRIERGAITLGTVTVTGVERDRVVGEFKGTGLPQAGDAAVRQQ